MIFVTVGTHEAGFDRLVQAVGALPGDEEVILQSGYSAIRPARARCVDFLGFDEMVATIRRARVVVCHAGVGSIMVSLMNGRRPVAVPRLARLGEHVDDHQLELGRRLAERDLIHLVEDTRELSGAVALDGSRERLAATDGPLAAEIRAFIAARVRPRG
jgi:UDP-N-acetylglucosamine transferase subunit ALG13